MRIIQIPSESTEIRAILEQARDEDLIVRSADGSEYLLTAVADFDRELVLTRRSEKLMELLEERARQTETIPLEKVKQQLDLDEE